MAVLRWVNDRLGPAEWTYVAAVALLAAVGLIWWIPPLLVLAGLASIPAVLLTLPLGYLVIGLLGLIPGANPVHAEGTGVVNSTERITTTAEGLPAAWYLAVIPVVLAVCLVLAAVLNALLARVVVTAWRARKAGPAQP